MLLRRFFCWTFYLVGLQCTQGAYLRYYGSSLEDYKQTEIRQPLPLLQWVDPSRPTLMYAFGYDGTPEKEAKITSAFIKRNDTNYILIDWEEEARNEQLQPVLAHALTASPNSIKLGKQLGISLLVLSCTLNLTTVQLAGHSLGAHLVGYAGSFLRERGIVLGRITGLDPSSYVYEGFQHSEGLSASSAAFVAIWHSNPGNYGTNKSLGNVDIWFNCGCEVQPGCKIGEFPAFSEDSLCSHSHATDFFAAAVNLPTSFIARRASNCEGWVSSTQSTACDILYVNDRIDSSASGDYYLSTGPQKPYARGKDGLESCC